MVKVSGKKTLQLKLKESSYFDPELLYAISHKSVARITPTVFSS